MLFYKPFAIAGGITGTVTPLLWRGIGVCSRGWSLVLAVPWCSSHTCLKVSSCK